MTKNFKAIVQIDSDKGGTRAIEVDVIAVHYCYGWVIEDWTWEMEGISKKEYMRICEQCYKHEDQWIIKYCEK